MWYGGSNPVMGSLEVTILGGILLHVCSATCEDYGW